MKYYLIGIKGNGMASLATILKDDGYEVEGEDTLDYIQTEDKLIDKNINIYPLNTFIEKEADVYIFGHSYEDKIPLLKNKFKVVYNDFLSFYLNKKGLISIVGSHGKTTLVGLLSYLLNSSYLRGDGTGYINKTSPYFVLESCEYENHFLSYNPEVIMLLNIDYDHTDFFKNENEYYASFDAFLAKKSKKFIPFSLKYRYPNSITIGDNLLADYAYKNVVFNEKNTSFDLFYKGKLINNISTKLKGIQFVEMITFCFAFFNENNINFPFEKVDGFVPASRRFNVYEYKNYSIIDDYAHHPSQIEMNYKNLSYLYNKYKKIAIFEPDRYSRLYSFINKYDEVLSKYDEVYVLPLPNMKENKGKSEKIFNLKKIKYIDSISEIKINYKDNVVYSFMSSKEMKKNIQILLNKLKKLK